MYQLLFIFGIVVPLYVYLAAIWFYGIATLVYKMWVPNPTQMNFASQLIATHLLVSLSIILLLPAVPLLQWIKEAWDGRHL